MSILTSLVEESPEPKMIFSEDPFSVAFGRKSLVKDSTENITFVTAFYKLYEEEPYEHKTIEWRIDNFRVLAKSGIKIIIYSCEKTREHINNLCLEFPENLFHATLLTPYEETEIYKMSMKKKDDGSFLLELPSNRNIKKDTYEYLTLMNCKIEFVRDAILQNHWGSHYFAWMDFSMAYLFSNKEETSRLMTKINFSPIRSVDEDQFAVAREYKVDEDPFTVACEEKEFYGEQLNKNNDALEIKQQKIIEKDLLFEERPKELCNKIVFPGCWGKITPNYYLTIKDNISWRFCGTFFLGDKESILEMYQFYIEHYPRFIKETNKLTWEINIWAWLEANTLWAPQWYSSDHNDRLITELF